MRLSKNLIVAMTVTGLIVAGVNADAKTVKKNC